MEVVGIGILFMLGIYLAPLVLGLIVATVGGVGYTICRMFGGCR